MIAMPEHDARASVPNAVEHRSRAHATNGRTDALTEKYSPNAESSPNATRAGGSEIEFGVLYEGTKAESFVAGKYTLRGAQQMVEGNFKSDPRPVRVMQRTVSEWTPYQPKDGQQ